MITKEAYELMQIGLNDEVKGLANDLFRHYVKYYDKALPGVLNENIQKSGRNAMRRYMAEGTIYGVSDNGKLVGFGSFRKGDGKDQRPSLDYLYVDPKHRHAGIGTEIIGKIRASVKGKPLTVDTFSKKLVDFYNKQGFTLETTDYVTKDKARNTWKRARKGDPGDVRAYAYTLVHKS